MEDRILAKAESKSDKAIEVLSSLVKIPSLTGEELAAQEFVAHYLKNLGLNVDLWEPDVEALFDKFPEVAQYPSHWQHDLILPYNQLPRFEDLIQSGKIDVLNYKNRPNVVGLWKGSGKGGKSLILNGHIDTVTVEPKEEWTHDPFGADIEDGKMYGRGVSDMKSGIVAALIALECLIELDVKLRGDVIFESVVNEEHAGNGTLACVARGITADAAIITEPTKNHIRLGNAGGVYWGVKVRGRSKPTGARWAGRAQDGISAIEKLPRVIDQLLSLEKELNLKSHHPQIPDQNTFSLVIGRINGGHYDTVTASECLLNGSAYFGSEIGSVTAVMEYIRNSVSAVSKKDQWFAKNPPEVFFLHHDDPADIAETEPIVQTLASAAEKVSGEKPPQYRGTAACDMRHLINQGKIPTTVFGPGWGDQVHKPDEFMPLDSMLPAIKILALTIYEWCK
ncbi:MAG: ArgE/DapE family deacylase [Desulfobacterales bacterium]|nr:MAG: ArgE/DapE family deacylase [Desulfobacterales bacterium]